MIRSVGYDSSRSLLEIEFASRKIYRYDNVPEDVFQRLLSAGSKGHYFEEEIEGRYQYRRVNRESG